MKKIISLFLFGLLVFSATAMATDAVTVTPYRWSKASGARIRVLKVAWVDSPSSTSLSDNMTAGDFESFLQGWFLFAARTVPGTGAAQPDDNYDITLADADGLDVMGGTLTNRDETNPEWVNPLINTYQSVIVNDDLDITVSGQATAAGAGTLWLYFHP